MDQFDIIVSVIGAIVLVFFKARKNKKLFKDMIADIFNNHYDLVSRIHSVEEALATQLGLLNNRILELEKKLTESEKKL